MHNEPGFYPNNVDIVVAMNNKTWERLCAQAFKYNGIYVSVDKITQKVAVHLPENQRQPPVFEARPALRSVENVQNKFLQLLDRSLIC